MIKRGDVFFIKRRNDLSFGSEIAKSRPGVVVSNNVLNATSDVVEVVYLTTQPKKDLPTHANVTATGVSSVALCEHIDHVSITLLDNYCGWCSDEEMADIDRALRCSLGLDEEEMTGTKDENIDPQAIKFFEELTRVTAERDVYKAMLDRFLPDPEN